MTKNIAVIIASLGRPDNLAALLERLAAQTQPPCQVILSMESEADSPPENPTPFPVERIFGPRGSCVQRNRGLDRLAPESDVVVFYDDDFVPSRFALAGMAQFFAAHPDIAGADGVVIKDGINDQGISPAEAYEIVDQSDADGVPPAGRVLHRQNGLYGCNMAYRVSAIGKLRFDENLPLYGWWEDLDFASRISGPLVKTDAFRGVHCGEKRGREKSGKKLGYSQVANPYYMVKKGTVQSSSAYRQIIRNVLANHAGMLKPEPWIDRRGRAVGNWRALFDILLQRSSPSRILDM